MLGGAGRARHDFLLSFSRSLGGRLTLLLNGDGCPLRLLVLCYLVTVHRLFSIQSLLGRHDVVAHILLSHGEQLQLLARRLVRLREQQRLRR